MQTTPAEAAVPGGRLPLRRERLGGEEGSIDGTPAALGAPRSLRREGGALVLVNGLLAAWLVLHPGTSGLFTGVDNLAQCAGLLLGAALCLPVTGAARHAAGRWASRFLGLGIVAETIGQSIYTPFRQEAARA